MKSALSSKLIGNNLVVVDSITLEEIKTKKIIGMLKALNVMNSAIMVLDDKNLNVEKSSRNIPGLKTARVNTINVLDLLKFEKMIVTKAAAEKIQEVYV